MSATPTPGLATIGFVLQNGGANWLLPFAAPAGSEVSELIVALTEGTGRLSLNAAADAATRTGAISRLRRQGVRDRYAFLFS